MNSSQQIPPAAPGRGRKRKIIVIATCLLTIAVLGAVAWLVAGHGRDVFIPSSIRQQLDFVVFYPEDTKDIKIDKSSYKYDAQTKLFSFTATAYSQKLVISMQALPGEFVDIPNAYDKYINDLNREFSFDNGQGVVYVTRPPNLHDAQVAVMQAKGTLLFVKADSSLTQDQWRQFFDHTRSLKS